MTTYVVLWYFSFEGYSSSGTRHCPQRFRFCLLLCQVLPDGHRNWIRAGLVIWIVNKATFSELESSGYNIQTFGESCSLWFWLQLSFFFFFYPHSWILTCRLGSLAKNDPMNSEMEWNKKRGLTGLSLAKERVSEREGKIMFLGMMKLAKRELWLKTALMTEWKWLPTLRHAARISIWPSLFSSVTQARLTRLSQLAASHSDQGKKSKWHPHLSPPKPEEDGLRSSLSGLRLLLLVRRVLFRRPTHWAGTVYFNSY